MTEKNLISVQGKNKINGQIKFPGDKSISHRALIVAALANGISVIDGILISEDVLSTAKCLADLGVNISLSDHKAVVEGKGLYLSKPNKPLYAGNSGTTMRLLSGVLAGQKFDSEITGDESLCSRPMQRVADALLQMNAKINLKDGKAPIRFEPAELNAIDYEMTVNSAQLKSCILLAGLFAADETVVIEPVPTRNHTESILKQFGADIQRQGNKITLYPSRLKAEKITVYQDISSAAFFMVAACLLPNSEITINDLNLNPTRDGIVQVLSEMNAEIFMQDVRNVNGEIFVNLMIKTSHLTGTVIQGAIIANIIDEIPILCVAAAFAKGKTVIKNANELKNKESDRIKAMVSGLSKMGADIRETDDGFEIVGVESLHAAEVDCFYDHRIEMAFVVAAMAAKGETKLVNAGNTGVSFPGFYELIENTTE